MEISVFDLFRIGIGPSSSHTVGPMRAALMFASELVAQGHHQAVHRILVELHGSLGATGKGHGSDIGVMLGLMGEAPDTVDVDSIDAKIDAVERMHSLALLGAHPVAFSRRDDISFLRREMPEHPNGMRFIAFDPNGDTALSRSYLSVGGGFVVAAGRGRGAPAKLVRTVPFPFTSGDDLIRLCAQHQRSIASLMFDNGRTYRSEAAIRQGLLTIWDAMQACVARGCRTEGHLPGSLAVKRRAAALNRQLQTRSVGDGSQRGHDADWLNLFALAVNEENAAGGRVVTAPTNGAAGIMPAVMHYYARFVPGASDDGIVDFLLTAAAIGALYKTNASISGAEVGCQGEVGVACSMAAAGLCAVLGGTPQQVENAAEIGMEHNLGLTCDPVGGRVQIPCIERNAMGAVKAVNAARLALHGDGSHYVSLDSVIRTMMQTGADMKTQYKETSRGGLAVNIIEC